MLGPRHLLPAAEPAEHAELRCQRRIGSAQHALDPGENPPLADCSAHFEPFLLAPLPGDRLVPRVTIIKVAPVLVWGGCVAAQVIVPAGASARPPADPVRAP